MQIAQDSPTSSERFDASQAGQIAPALLRQQQPIWFMATSKLIVSETPTSTPSVCGFAMAVNHPDDHLDKKRGNIYNNATCTSRVGIRHFVKNFLGNSEKSSHQHGQPAAVVTVVVKKLPMSCRMCTFARTSWMIWTP